MNNEETIEERLEREAADWFAAMHSGETTPELRQRFEAWLHGDRTHKIAYREFEQVYRDLDHVAVEAGVDVDGALVRQKAGWVELVAGWLRRPAFALVAAALMAIPVAAYLTTREAPGDLIHAAAPDYVTKTAEIRDITLEDGTRVTLGARSKIATAFTPKERRVTLLEGEAFFEVTKDPDRPFYVAAQDTLVRVVGTKFDVKRSAEIVHVSVLEGIVEVMKPDNIEKAIETADSSAFDKQILTAGERVSAARRVALPEARQVETAKPGVWREGRLAYEDASLAEIVADVNRYYDRRVRIATSDVGDLRSTIAFNSSEIDQFFDVIETIQPVSIDRAASGDIIIKRKR
ncbi:FecR family protein [Hyphococcus luteus]|uniref:Iron dicitrate transport regulator FecR n=1 Tax=Hyphococcus luteus TaxID=2058213 RepID=A0A2S7K3U4_9PROT|nr:FecR domain-containing protein [Marinicaulis flavus]PQA87167.1 hypothetical protein CW354_14100 [Marinicaulis flavus]